MSIDSTNRLPRSPCVPKLGLRQITACLNARSLALMVGSTPSTSGNVESLARCLKKPLTQTLRAMKRDELIDRKIFPVVPPRVEKSLTARRHLFVKPLDMFDAWTTKEQGGQRLDRSSTRDPEKVRQAGSLGTCAVLVAIGIVTAGKRREGLAVRGGILWNLRRNADFMGRDIILGESSE